MTIRGSPALILRRFPFGESSLVVQALARDFGRVHLMAKGAFRPRGAFSWALDYFDTLELEWSHARARSGQGELETLRRAEILVRREAVAGDLERYRTGMLVLELAGLDAREGEPARELFELCERALDDLAGCSVPPARVRVAFELAFLRHLGLAPSLEHCAACGGAAPLGQGGRAVFSALSGGRLCAEHAREARDAGRRVGTLPGALLQAASAFLELGSGAPLPRAGEERVLLAELSEFCARYLEVHLEFRPKSLAAAGLDPGRGSTGGAGLPSGLPSG